MKFRILSAGLVAAIAATQIAHAQVTTATKPDGAWRGGIGLGMALSSGNSESTSINGAADAVKQTGIDKLGLYISTIRSTNKVNGVDVTTASLLRFGGRYDRDFTEAWYGFGGLDVDKDKPADIRWRYVPQAGLGLHVIKDPRTTFDVFAGLAYNKTTRYFGPDSTGIESLIGEESTHKLTDTTSFVQRFVAYPGLTSDRSGEYRLVFDAGLKAQVVGGWNLVVTVGSRYDSEPAPGRKSTDTVIFTGLQYGWGPSAK